MMVVWLIMVEILVLRSKEKEAPVNMPPYSPHYHRSIMTDAHHITAPYVVGNKS